MSLNLSSKNRHLWWWWRVSSFLLLLLLLIQIQPSLSLNSDGVLLLHFKYSILSDPLSALETWNYDDETPCSWNGVTCTEIETPGSPELFRVTSLELPNSQLLGSIPEELGMIQHLLHLDLSSNLLNGSLPNSILNSSQLQSLSLANNVISGELPELIGKSTSLHYLNLSDNAIGGDIPRNLTTLQNLTVVSLKSNFFSGSVPSGFNSVEILDLSSNLLNGSLPSEFGGERLRNLNISNNKVSGTIPQTFARHIPVNATIDLSFNNLTGPIPESLPLLNQRTESLAGNADLCGKPLKNLCSIPSTLSDPPTNVTGSSSPAIAAIPRTIGDTPSSTATNTTAGSASQNVSPSGLKPAAIAAIVVGDLAGIAVIALIILFVYQQRKARDPKPITDNAAAAAATNTEKKIETVSKQDLNVRAISLPCSCLQIKQEEASEATSSDSDIENNAAAAAAAAAAQNGNHHPKEGTLVTVDGETNLDLETLLKASAYVLGTSGGSIVYKAVLHDGRVFAVRRIGECGIVRMKDFENQVRSIAKLRHPNLVKIRGFSWGKDEKLLISDFAPNGSLATIGGSRRAGSSSPLNMPLEVCLKIGKGVARGLAFIHEKKHVHGNVKPSNILLSSEMEPIVGDFGLDRLLLNANNDINHRASGSARLQDPTAIGSSPYATTAIGMPSSSSAGGTHHSHYHAPESLQNIKPNPKWDVYSFGVVLLELLSGRVLSDWELDHLHEPAGSVEEDKNRVLRLADVSIKSDVAGRESAILACFNLGIGCASIAPHKRPSMKEALQILDKIPYAAVN